MIKLVLRETQKLYLNIFYPKKCIICNSYGEHLCLGCAADIELVKTSICPICGKISMDGKYCSECKKASEFVLKGIISACTYKDETAKEIVHHLKYNGLTDLSEILGELIKQKLSQNKLLENSVIVPVPLHTNRESERGFNQSELIAKYVAKNLGTAGGNALVRTKNSEPQAKLKRRQRLSNLKNCFEVADQEFIDGKRVLLIDDVATTGATLNECARVLMDAGAKEVWGVVVAHG